MEYCGNVSRMQEGQLHDVAAYMNVIDIISKKDMIQLTSSPTN
jgi:hypothetical protein